MSGRSNASEEDPDDSDDSHDDGTPLNPVPVADSIGSPCGSRSGLKGFDRISLSPFLCSSSKKQRFMCFHYFHTFRIGKLISFIRAKELVKKGEVIHVTGGGAFRFHKQLEDELGVEVVKFDEMSCVMAGLAFLISSTQTAFRFDVKTQTRVPVDLEEPIYPFLVVNIGSGVSILKATAPGKFVRLTGTCIGGGTVMGLAKLLCQAESFDEVINLSQNGTDSLDLTVGDLFGDAAGSRCLPPDTVASSFGRLFSDTDDPWYTSLKDTRKEDIARSLIHMVSYNIGNIAYLVATINNVRRIFFAGKYINNIPLTMSSISYGVEFYQQHYNHNNAMMSCERGGKTDDAFEVLFLWHDGYLGALGALISPI
eukprot:GHVN01038786.1.p1 GENE.GHVN01038786.1~~GHVN01038786.1.p1  ORF type:complete len:368 (-),score=58.28 GHVN01038786.1:64-1167(-)